jgi:hypothetical protein
MLWFIEKVVKCGKYLFAVVPNHPNAYAHGYVLLHRVVMENSLDRILTTEEIVHHKNENTHDCALENLEIWSRSAHSSYHGRRKGRKFLELCCPICDKTFLLPKNQSHLQKSKCVDCTCCSRSCAVKLAHKRRQGEDQDILQKIEGNILREFYMRPEE